MGQVSLKGSRGFGSDGYKRPIGGKGESPCEEVGAKVQFIHFSVIDHNFSVPSKKAFCLTQSQKYFLHVYIRIFIVFCLTSGHDPS